MTTISESDFYGFTPAKEQALQEEIKRVGTIESFKKGELLIRAGQYLKVLPIVLKGVIRVFQTHEDREILLYYVQPQETCIMSLAACLFNNESPSYAITEADTDVLFIPSRYINEWQRSYNSWNNFILKAYRNRYDELLGAFNSVVFKHIDERVINYLNTYALDNNTQHIPLSHQALAYELGTTRVVISRILKNLESKDLLVLHRGFIELKK